jgi:hypothetical protein
MARASEAVNIERKSSASKTINETTKFNCRNWHHIIGSSPSFRQEEAKLIFLIIIGRVDQLRITTYKSREKKMIEWSHYGQRTDGRSGGKVG